MKAKYLLILILSALGCVLPAKAADNAAKILDGTAAKLRAARSITAAYTLTSPQGSASGTLTLAGERFVMTTADVDIWYDGTTQWVLVKADNEVNITEPTAAELQQVNPFVILNNFRKNYTCKTIGTTATEKKIQLTARIPKADIRSAVIAINPATMYPKSVTLTMASGHTVAIRIASIKQGNQLPLNTFRFPAKKYPRVEIVDLR